MVKPVPDFVSRGQHAEHLARVFRTGGRGGIPKSSRFLKSFWVACAGDKGCAGIPAGG